MPTPTTKKRSVSPKKSQTAGKAAKKKVAQPTGTGGDIRNFFSQGSSGGPSKASPSKNGAGTGRKPITIDDSDDEIEIDQVLPASAALPKPTTSKHFPTATASSSKAPIVLDSPSPSPSPPKSKPKAQQTKPPTTKPEVRSPPPPTARSPPKSASKPNMKRKSIVDPDSEEDIKPAAKRQSIGKAKAKKPNYLASPDEDEDMDVEDIKPRVEVKKAESVKGKSKGKAGKDDSPMSVDSSSEEEEEEDFDDEDEEDEKPKKGKVVAKAKAPAKKAAPAKRPPAKKEPVKKASKKENVEADEDAPKKPKFDYRAAAAARKAGPSNPGSKEIPEGAPDCLAGLTFVFTGELESLGRDEAIELAKRYSGKVTTAPSSKTSFVVLGANAGPSKVKKIEEMKIPTLNEDEFLELIRGREGAEMDEKAIKVQQKKEKEIVDQAKAMEKKEKEDEKLRLRKEAALEGTGMAAKKVAPLSSQLWTTKYAPTNIKEICGNKAPVERLGQWLQEWEKNYKVNFKKPGKDGMGIYRAVLISGPPGIGKTTSAHLMAKAAGYNPIELNASDARSKKLVENHTNIDNTSLDGFFSGTGVQSTTAIGDIRVDHKTCLIMDEVDGMSAGDRGGVGALNGLIKKTRIPMILICNDRTLQKMKPLQSTTFNMTFRRPGPNEIRSRIMSILFKEKLKIPGNVVDELVKGANSDIRQVLNMLSTFKLGKSEMDFDEGKQLIKVNEKNTIMTPFTIIDKMTSPYAFSRTNKDTLNDKLELYFHDFSFVPLFMQEHYIKTQPSLTNNLQGPEQNLKHLDLLTKAADSISDGDLVDRMIHGSEQHWSLLPLHAFASTIRPASMIYGPMRPSGGAGGWGPSFPQWLGQNSKQGKLQRQLTDIQIRMRLKVSGSRQEIREQYMPMLAGRIVMPLVNRGLDAVEETIGYMDEYYLGKEDWDALVELGVDSMRDELILKKIPTATKSAFTRQYNKADHPIAFHKGDMFAASKKKIADQGPAPDNEDVFEEDEIAPEETSEKEEDEDEEINDVSKDRLIKAVKPKGAAKGKAADKVKVEKGKKK